MGTGRIQHGRDSVVYVGMNDSSTARELDALRQGNPGITPVLPDGPDNVRSRRDDSYFVTPKGVKGHHADLATKKGREAFVKFLDVPPATAKKIAAVLAKAPEGLRDELAQLAVGWAAAERGERGASRLVLSGHSDGDKIWGERGEDSEALTPKLLGELARAMPKAAAQVEDLAISACSCGGRATIEEWKKDFPNLKTLLAYRTSSPTVEQGSTNELQKWERFTRGAATELDAKQFNPNAATWSVKHGYLTPKSIDLQKVQQTIDTLKPLYLAVRDGTQPLDADTKAKLNTYRTALRELGGADSDQVSRDVREQALTDAKSVLLAVHYDDVKDDFQRTYRAELKAAYQELGLQPKDFGKLSRREAYDECARVITEISKRGYPPSLEAALTALRGMKSFDPEVLNTAWATR